MSGAPTWVRRAVIGLLAWCLWSGAVVEAEALPQSPEPRYVLDEPGWLSPAGFQALDARLMAYERETSSQLVVAVFGGLPADAELVDFSQRVFEFWKPGDKAKDNGVVLFVFARDRKLRIHTGYGMEGVLPDARCKQIIEEVIKPLLQQNRREEALSRGVDAIIAATRGEYRGDGRTRLDGKPSETILPVPILVILVILVLLIWSARSSNPDVVISRRGSRHGDWGGWSSGGWGGGGGGGGGGFSGGGFSGGGGSSGGGGASGSW